MDPAGGQGAGAGGPAAADDSSAGTWASPLGSWLRGILDDPFSRVPSVGRVFETLRIELEKAPVLGVVFVRLDYWGAAVELCGWKDLERVYQVVSGVTVDIMGKELRRVDLPADIGLHGEGLAVFLSAPRGDTTLGISVVDMVGNRVGAAVRQRIGEELPAEVAERICVDIGSGLLGRPTGDDTLEDVVLAALIAADKASRAAQRDRLEKRAEQLVQILEAGPLQVTYRPIVDALAQRVVGFEAFAEGPVHPDLRLGDVLLDTARRSGLAYRAYDAYHHAAVIGAEGGLADDDLLVLEVSASELLESAVRVLALLFRRGVSHLTPGNIVFTVQAHEVVAQFPPVLAASRSVADMGFKLAVHLAPDGPLPFDLLRELRPDILRVGGRTVRELGRNQDEFDLLLMLSRFAGRHGMGMMATDCSDQADLLALSRSGVNLVQGDAVAPRQARPVKAGVSGR